MGMNRLMDSPLLELLAKSWWMLLLRGISAIVFGLLLWLQPQNSLATIILFLAVYTSVDGLLGILTALSQRREEEYWWAMLFWGFMGIGVGVFTFLMPNAAIIGVLFLVAFWTITSGLLQLVVAMRLRKELKGEWLLMLSGALSIIFGISLFVQPYSGVMALLWLLAIYAVVLGAILVLLSFKVKRFAD